MKITIIGTINKDLILPFNYAPIESFGGIFYDISVLSQLADQDDQIVPVSFIGEDVLPTVEAILNKLPNVSMKGLIPLQQKNHKVILEYTSPEEREEKSLFQFPPLAWRDIAPHLDADMVMVNLITGWDIESKVYLKLSQQFRDRLYLDIHYLIMGIDKMGRRFPTQPHEVRDWLSGARFLQMNEKEYRLICGDSRTEVEFFQHFLKADQILLTTRAAKGAIAVYQRNNMIGHKQFPAFKIPRIVDSTGCGDAFGAGFVINYLQTGDILKAVEYANLVAGATTALRGTNEMHKLEETMKQVQTANYKPAK